MLFAPKRFARCIAVAAMLSAFCSAAVAYDYRDFLLTKAVSAIGKKDYDGAVEIYSEALGLRPDTKAQAEILSLRATVFGLADKAEQAEADYTAVIKLMGARITERLSLSRLFLLSSKSTRTRARGFRRWSQAFSGQRRISARRGSGDGKFEEAIRRYDQAIKLDATSGEFMLGRAEAHNRWDQPKRALEDYDKALELGGLVRRDKGRLRSGRGYAHLEAEKLCCRDRRFQPGARHQRRLFI